MNAAGRLPWGAVRRTLAVVPLLATLTVVGPAVRLGPSVGGCAEAAPIHHAALVAQHADGTVVTRCVAFSEDSITGDELFVLANPQVEYATADYSGSGKAVCQVDYEPAQYPASCWTASSRYWAMYVSRGGGAWAFSNLGISSQTFHDGDAEGFRYEGQSDYSAPQSPRGVCPPPATPAPLPSATAKPAPSGAAGQPATPSSHQPKATPSPGDTGTPSAAVVASPAAAATGTAPPVAALATPRVPPPAQPGLMSAGAWAAAGLASVLVVLLLVRSIGLRRRRSPPTWQQP